MKLGDKVRDKYGNIFGTVADVKIHMFYKDKQPITSATYEAVEDEHGFKFKFYGNQIGSKFFKVEEEDNQMSFL